jgi:hypothetical protein
LAAGALCHPRAPTRAAATGLRETSCSEPFLFGSLEDERLAAIGADERLIVADLDHARRAVLLLASNLATGETVRWQPVRAAVTRADALQELLLVDGDVEVRATFATRAHDRAYHR